MRQKDVVVFSKELCNQNYGQPQVVLRETSGHTEYSLNSGFDSGSSSSDVMSCLEPDQNCDDAPQFVKPAALLKVLAHAPSPEPQIDPELVAAYFQRYPHHQHQKKELKAQLLVPPPVDEEEEEVEVAAGSKPTTPPSVEAATTPVAEAELLVDKPETTAVVTHRAKPEGYPCHCRYCKSYADAEPVEVSAFVPPPVKRKGNAFFLDEHKLHAGGKLTTEALQDLHNEKLLEAPQQRSKFRSLCTGPLGCAPQPKQSEEEQLTAANLEQHDKEEPGIFEAKSRPSDTQSVVSKVTLATGVSEKKVWGHQSFTKDHFDDVRMKTLQASEAYLKAWETKTTFPEADLVKEEENADGWYDLSKPELVAHGVPSFRFTREQIMERFARKRPQEKDLKYYSKKLALKGLWTMLEENGLTCVDRVGVGVREVWSNVESAWVYKSNTVAYLTFDGSRRGCMREISSLMNNGLTHGVCKINFVWNDKVQKPKVGF